MCGDLWKIILVKINPFPQNKFQLIAGFFGKKLSEFKKNH